MTLVLNVATVDSARCDRVLSSCYQNLVARIRLPEGIGQMTPGRFPLRSRYTLQTAN